MTATPSDGDVQVRYSRAALVDEVSGEFGFTDGAFRMWQSKGLIASPSAETRWESGRAGSREAMYSEIDRQMLRSLLVQRERIVATSTRQFSLTDVADFVVWTWIFWDGFVAIDQVRRAMRTRAEPMIGGLGRARSRHRMKQAVRALVEQLAAPGVPLRVRKTVVERMTDVLWAGNYDALPDLAPDVESVMDPDHTGRRVGPPGASVGTVDALRLLHLRHLGANDACSGEPLLTDSDWLWARREMRESWGEYEIRWPSFAAESTDEVTFRPPTDAYQIEMAAQSLLTMLGIRIESL